MRTNGRVAVKAPVDALDDGRKLARLMRAFYPLLMERAFRDAHEAGITVAWDLDNPHVQTVLATLARRIVAVSDTTRQEVRDLVGQQAREGWSIDELADQIASLAEIHTRERALLISRTESATAYTQGSLAAYRASGVVDRVEWLLGPDPCEICQGLGGAVVPLGEEFLPGVDGPPAHPRCVCALAPVVKGS